MKEHKKYLEKGVEASVICWVSKCQSLGYDMNAAENETPLQTLTNLL